FCDAWRCAVCSSLSLHDALPILSSIPQALGLDVDLTSAFLGNDAMAIYWVALAQCWAHVGQLMVIYVAGLQSIPADIDDHQLAQDRKSTRLNSSHVSISYAVFCL